MDQYDVIILGGGLAGLSLAIQLKQEISQIKILVIEKKEHPLPEAAHKVGESSVEISSHYFSNILGLKSILEKELRKFGLRFFFTEGNNQDIASRAEIGPSHFFSVPSYHQDRGRFENALGKKCLELGVDFRSGWKLKNFTLEKGNHQVVIKSPQEKEISARSTWLIDACGRAGLFRKKLKLNKKSPHRINSSWFRVQHPIDLHDWSNQESWKKRIHHSRGLSTNHLMGKGYWVWLIPLVSGSTSIGIVADDQIHSFQEICTFDKALIWLKKYESQCANVIEEHLDQRLDFLALKHYSHDCRKLFSDEGWGITGDAGRFLDPFYSPGSDFIGINNCILTELIKKDLLGKNIAGAVQQYNSNFRSLFLSFSLVYQDQYPLMGNSKVMMIKIIWDFAIYWGSIAFLFYRGKYCDLEFMERVKKTLRKFYIQSATIQTLFREWGAIDFSNSSNTKKFVDYSQIDFLANLNRNLLVEMDDVRTCEQLEKNFLLIQQLAFEIQQEAVSEFPQLHNTEWDSSSVPTPSSHFKEIFSLLRS